jgi:hypothetical protein
LRQFIKVTFLQFRKKIQLAPQGGFGVKTLVRLRWFFIGAFIAALLSFAAAVLVIQFPRMQVRLFGEPNYHSLFSQVIAEDLNRVTGNPVGVYADEDLAGCDQARNHISVSLSPGLPQRAEPYPLTVDTSPVAEIRYSQRKKMICVLYAIEHTSKGVLGKLPIFAVNPSFDFPQTPESIAGNFVASRFRTIDHIETSSLAGWNWRSLAYEKNGPGVEALRKQWPVLPTFAAQKNFAGKVADYYRSHRNSATKATEQVCLSLSGFCAIALIVLFRRCSALAKNERQITLASYAGGSASRVVKLAGKISFPRFLFCRDISDYIEAVYLRQTEALLITEEWQEARRQFTMPAQPTNPATEARAATGMTSRRLLKLLNYTPTPRDEQETEAQAQNAVRLAVKIVVQGQALRNFAIPQGLLPGELSVVVVMAATDILKTLLAGSGGLACFGQHRMSATRLRKAVMNHRPAMTGSPAAYAKALNWLMRHGVVNELNESAVLSYSITVGEDKLTEQGLSIRNFLIRENQKRRGGKA